MLEFVKSVTSAIWEVSQEMAPYLLLGFLVAGILSQFLNAELVQRFLGGKGLGASIKATLVGIPLPLCSCGVIPVAASLRKQGAGKGAVASFLTSTPQTGVDSILASYALMGWVFAIVRVVAAFITGVICGVFVDMEKETAVKEVASDEGCCSHSKKSCCDEEPAEEEKSCCSGETPVKKPNRLVMALRYGFVELPGEIGRALAVGLLLAGLITALIPENFFSGYLSEGIVALMLITLVAVPLYVCSTGSIPFAFALMQAGLSPGTALVFLITGPATNAATISTINQMLGRRATIKYLVSLILCSWAIGWIFDLLPLTINLATTHEHPMDVTSILKIISALLLFAILVPPFIPKRKQTRGSTPSHSRHEPAVTQ